MVTENIGKYGIILSYATFYVILQVIMVQAGLSGAFGQAIKSPVCQYTGITTPPQTNPILQGISNFFFGIGTFIINGLVSLSCLTQYIYFLQQLSAINTGIGIVEVMFTVPFAIIMALVIAELIASVVHA